MLEEDIDDTHLCIKCSSTIVGLENYVQHRKRNCCSGGGGKSTSNRAIVQVQVDHPYGTFDFTETQSSFSKTSEEVEKVNKSLSDTYDLPYDLGADVFFQSLELQSSSKQRVVQPTTTITTTASVGTNNGSSSVTCGPSVSVNVSDSIHGSGGKVSTSTSGKILTRKATAALLHHQVVENDDAWIDSTNNSENLMKAVRDLSRHNKCDSLFKLNFQHDSPDQTDDDVDDDDEDYEPSVPVNHTGGKWKPENPLRPILLRNSPAWDDRHQWEMTDSNVEDKPIKDVDDFEHDLNPPPSHTKGKWVPGSKVIKLDYKEDVEIEKIYSHQYWCNTCNRKLASKSLYERHLKSNLHLKRAKPEQELEQAEVKTLSERMKKPSIYLNSSIYSTELLEGSKSPAPQNLSSTNKKKRQRHKYFTKCETCKTRLPKYRLGKHLISHYHYRRMILNPSKSFQMVLKNMHRIIHQSPFQCQPCRFYTNTENDFILHWNSNAHRDLTEGPGRFWCRYCKFECEDNNQMRRHLLGMEHKEVILAINRSVPILIGKKVTIECTKCKQNFRYNMELRKHAEHCSSNEPLGTASNIYQSKFECIHCEEIVKSKRSLQKHLKTKHKEFKYFCTVCKIDFETAIEVKKHRSTSEHKSNIMAVKNRKSVLKKCRSCGEILADLIALKNHIEKNHPEEKCTCPYCGKSFIISQELGRHVRDKVCQASTSTAIMKTNENVMSSPSASNDFMKQKASISAKTEIIIKEEQINFELDAVPIPTEGKQLECEHCSFSTPLAAELLFHRILHTVPSTSSNQTKLTCPICSKIFRKHSLRCHLRQHTNEKIFECQHCKMRFARKHNLKTHIRNIHNPKPTDDKQSNKNLDCDDNEIPKINPNFQCDTCGKIFNKKYSLKQHINIHGERDKRFSCPVGTCIFVGRNDYDLRIHSTIHLDEKNFRCDFKGCEYSGKTSANLKKHTKTHQPANKEFHCTNCDFRTRISGHLKRHLRIHSGEKPYRCPHCDYACNSSENLRKHVLTTNKHQGRSLYECKFCTDDSNIYHTNFQKDYRSHLVMVHHIEKDLNEFLTF